MKILVMLLLSTLLTWQNAFANGKSCDYIFNEPNWRSTLSKLDDLGPVALDTPTLKKGLQNFWTEVRKLNKGCLLYTSPSPRDGLLSRMPSSA